MRPRLACGLSVGLGWASGPAASLAQIVNFVNGSWKYSVIGQNGFILCCYTEIAVSVCNIRSSYKFLFCERISMGLKVNAGKL